MATNLTVCEIDQSVKDKLKKFRFRKEKNNAAVVMKCDYAKQIVVLDEEHEDLSIEELAQELPSTQPRFVVYSFEHLHDDGRKSYPMFFIFVSPAGCKPEQQMLYSGTKLSLVNELGCTKVFEVRSIEELTEEWLMEKVKFFR